MEVSKRVWEVSLRAWKGREKCTKFITPVAKWEGGEKCTKFITIRPDAKLAGNCT